jgi:predicted nuclease of predicted toxin-antitoxin system
MRILVDECVDWRILRDLKDHDAKTVKQLGWEHIDDGALLALAAAQFDVFLTVDKDLPREQNIASFDIAVVVLRARTTRLVDLRELLVLLREALRNARPRELQILSWRDVL